ncbi:pyrroloquinoline quinone precursor peptide PqqA [Pseudomonas sp.]|uniref:pyrroloquinoline quinone precursor peptide PqqA n=1 Tax=Pseudomonas sp. TaxID=306 RepID=UPI0028A7CFBF|nr:pyrroloquinoline quinone precursor peptide PqqA [Pseudomonas sp.]
MTIGKPGRAQCNYFSSAKKPRPIARKTGPKVLLGAAPARLSFNWRHSFPSLNTLRRCAMQWIDPDFCDLRLGFEVTAYVYVR